MMSDKYGEGYQRLWNWFGLSYASFLVIPRVMLHEMSDEWQGKLADLLEEGDQVWTNAPDFNYTIRTCDLGGKLTKMPDVLKQYRRPDLKTIRSWKQEKTND